MALVMCTLFAGDLMYWQSSAQAASDLLQITLRRGTVSKAYVRPGTTVTVETDRQFSDIVVGDQTVADIVPLSETSLYIQGKEIGFTNVTLFDADKNLLGIIDIRVAVDSESVASALRAAAPTARVNVTNVGKRIRLSGTVRNPVDLKKVVEVAQQFSEEPIINALSVGAAQQVSLEVRVLEASRSAGRNLGINLLATRPNVGVSTGDRLSTTTIDAPAPGTGVQFATGIAPALGGVSAGLGQSLAFGTILARVISAGNTNIDVLIDALEEKGVARSLAQPNLTSVSGEPARFHVGGEVPIETAVSNGGGVASQIDYRPFGVRLEFVPTILDSNKVNVRILTEVSDIDPTISVNGNPGFTSRRAETVVELRDGQSFALAGLLQTRNARALQQFPWLGQVPVLGTLFRSAAFQKEETDLVIVVTPRLVRPAAPGEELASPLDQTRPTNDLELFGLGLLEVDKDMLRKFANGEGIIGPYGHIIDLEFNDAFVVKK